MSKITDKIKVAFFDFDDTLCIHPHNKGVFDYYEYLKGCLKNNLYGESIPPERMVQFVQALHDSGVKQYCLTAGDHSLAIKPKSHYLDWFYTGCFEDVIVTKDAEQKVQVMKAFAEVHNLLPEQILFVDDFWYTVELAAKAGFTVLSTVQVLAVPDINNMESWVL